MVDILYVHVMNKIFIYTDPNHKKIKLFKDIIIVSIVLYLLKIISF